MTIIGDPRAAGQEGAAGDQRPAGDDGPAGDPRLAGNDSITGAFDPSDHTVTEVNAHLEEADDAERDRVLAAERAGKDRSSIIG